VHKGQGSDPLGQTRSWPVRDTRPEWPVDASDENHVRIVPGRHAVFSRFGYSNVTGFEDA